MQKKNNFGELAHPNFTIYHKSTLIERVWYWHQVRNEDQLIKLRDKNKLSQLHSLDFWQGCQDKSVGERIVFLTNGPGYPYTK